MAATHVFPLAIEPGVLEQKFLGGARCIQTKSFMTLCIIISNKLKSTHRHCKHVKMKVLSETLASQ